jgi:hypothetical protein
MRRDALAVTVLLSIAVAAPALADTCTTTPWSGMSGVPPLTEFPPGYLYLGLYPGFLYRDANEPPSDHDLDGRTFANGVVPRDAAGSVCTAATAGCKIVFLSIGFSNNTIEFCGGQGIGGDPDDPEATACPLPTANPPYIQDQSFIARALHDPTVNHATTVLVDGAKGGQTLADWDPTVSGTGEYDRVRDEILTPSGLTEAQVESIWVKDADARPTVSLATQDDTHPADAIVAERYLGDIMRAIRARYPNVKQVFLSSRIYGGYANTASPPNDLNPEPYAFEIGYSVKWLIQSQIEEVRSGTPDPTAGSLDYRNGTAPWIAWGPYMWANGTTPRVDGLVWLNADLRGAGTNECTHPGTDGELKVATMLLDFMKRSPYTGWFLSGPAVCGIAPDSLRFAADKVTLSWVSNVPTGPFDVAKGDLATLRATGGFSSASCRPGITTTSTVDTGVPFAGGGAFYLVRCEGGTWNDGTQQGDRDTTLTACP